MNPAVRSIVFAGLGLGLALMPGARALQQAGPNVRLLFPVLHGRELDLLLPLAPQATLVEVGGASFVQVASFVDARVAHRLGLSIQRRLKLPFDLAYDPNHPQIDLALGGGLLQERPGAVARSTPRPVAQPAAPTSPVAYQQTQPAAVAAPEAPRPDPTRTTQSHPWLRPVPVAAVALGVPISRLQVASSSQLTYLYVKIQQPADVAQLQRIVPVAELTMQGDNLLARVGVFNRSRTSQQLLDERLARLRRERLEPLVARGGEPIPPS